MADPPHYPDTGNDTGVRPDQGSATGTPRWVKVFGIVVAVLVLLIVAAMFIGGGHGPGRHASSGGAGGQAPPPGIVAIGHTSTEGGPG